MSYSCNDNQNYFVSAGRTTSRVSNPPGGASSFSLGLPDAPKKAPSPPSGTAEVAAVVTPTANPAAPIEVVATEAAVQEGENPAAVATPAGESPFPPGPPPAGFLEENASSSSKNYAAPPQPLLPGDNTAPVSSNAFASGANMNGANVMTGRPTSRVLAPPGGHSATGGRLW